MRLKPFPPEFDDYYASEHPDDKSGRLASTAQAREAIAAFAAAHYQELADLLVTYGDGLAEEKLSELREEFWLSLPVSP